MAVGDRFLLRLKVDQGASGLQGGLANEALLRSTEGMGSILSGGSYLGYSFQHLQAAGWRVLSVNAIPGLDGNQDSFLEIIIEETGSVDLKTLAFAGVVTGGIVAGAYLGAVLIAPGVLAAIFAFAVLFGLVFSSWVLTKLATADIALQGLVEQKAAYKQLLDLFNSMIAAGVDPNTAAGNIAEALKNIKPPVPPGGSFDWIFPIALLVVVALLAPPILQSFKSSGGGGQRSRAYDPGSWAHGLAKRAIEGRVLR